MSAIIFWTIIFSIAGTVTTVLLGDRNLIAGNLLSANRFISLIFHWKFIVAMLGAFAARYSFMLINNNLLKFPNLAQNSTTITALITLVSVIFMVAGNALFLGERINAQQWFGAALIMVGIWVVLK
jgi:drug/metabolite transporter (DMT)-like permease